MIQLSNLVDDCDALLDAGGIADFCPNGLQVAGRDTVQRLITGVTASTALLDAAIEAGADAVLVHHGYFWKGEDARVTGMKAARLRRLLREDVSLLAYHLPLDVHPSLGNNACLAPLLTVADPAAEPAMGVAGLLWHGALSRPLPADELAAQLARGLGRAPLHIAGGPPVIRRIAWCSGGAQKLLPQAAALGVDAYLSGEISEQTTHEARELGVHYFAAGHHATERGGVRALGERLAERHGLVHRFIDIDNPA